MVPTLLLIQNTNAHEVLGDNYKYFTFVSHIFLHIHDPLSIPCLEVIFVFIAIKVLLQFINILHLVAIYFVLHQWNLFISCLADTCPFSLFYANNF